MISSKANIEKYIGGKMSPRERNEFEKEMSMDPFLKDAVDGYQSYPAGLQTVPKLKSNGVAGAVVVGVISIALLFSFWPESTESDLQYEPIHQEPMLLIEETEGTELISMELITSLELERQVKATPALDQRPVKMARNELQVEAVPRVGIDEIAFERKGAIKSNVQIVYVYDLKLAVAPAYLNSEPEGQNYVKSLPASQERPFRSPSVLFQKYVNSESEEPSYIDQFDRALRAIKKERYGKAKKELLGINMESDVNLLFYLGLCEYHLNEFESAGKNFERSRQHLVQSFYEEATWYLAASLLEMGQKEEAIHLYKEILLRNGHYSPMAASRLARLTP